MILPVVDPSSIWQAFKEKLGSSKADFVISNPPYLAPSDPIDQDVLAHEPSIALFPANGDPCYFYRGIAAEARDYLRPRGLVLLEIPSFRAREIHEIFVREKWDPVLVKDLNQQERVLAAQFKP
jgi:release factor glutamine methyltransferase